MIPSSFCLSYNLNTKQGDYLGVLHFRKKAPTYRTQTSSLQKNEGGFTLKRVRCVTDLEK